jgi:rRNA small subunit pseudouridine methyltransferase Nep1
MLTIILADSELELIPDEILRERSVTSHAKRRGKKARELLLDSSMHHTAMAAMPDKTRRGRPDMIHTTLLVALESVEYLDGGLRVFVHTRNDMLMRFDPAIRLPKNYNRFVGLIEQLFATGQVPRECAEGQAPLITMEKNKTLGSIVKELLSEASEENAKLKTVVFSDSGEQKDLRTFFSTAVDKDDDLLCIIGGFPEGDFISAISEIESDGIISIYPETLKAWTVAAEIIVNYRNLK